MAVVPAPAGAQAVGSEFQVNTYTTSTQELGSSLDNPKSVAADARGNFVVVWQSRAQDGLQFGVFGQRYDAQGGARGGEFQVNSYTPRDQRVPAVASDARGNFVVVWQSGFNQDGDREGVFGQRYDSNGVAQGQEFLVNSYTTEAQDQPSVASGASGNFVVVWSSWDQDGSDEGIFGQRYDRAGVPQGGEFQINSYTMTTQYHPFVASDAGGNFVVVWESQGQDGIYSSVRGQRHDSAGVALGAEFRVTSHTTRFERFPSIASDSNGNFVVVWKRVDPNRIGEGIFGQRYDSEGSPRGGEFFVNTYTPGPNQDNPTVAVDPGGSFIVTWENFDQDGSDAGVFGRRYDSGGVAQGDEFQVNSFTLENQRGPSVGAAGSSRFVVAWESSNGQDGDLSGVFAQRLDFGPGSIAVVSPNANVVWRIGSLQRIKWTHTLGLGATFRIELDRDDDGSYEELIAADAPADGATRGHFAWTVTGPASGAARMRVSSTDDPGVSDASDVTFQIRPVPVDESREE